MACTVVHCLPVVHSLECTMGPGDTQGLHATSGPRHGPTTFTRLPRLGPSHSERTRSSLLSLGCPLHSHQTSLELIGGQPHVIIVGTTLTMVRGSYGLRVDAHYYYRCWFQPGQLTRPGPVPSQFTKAFVRWSASRRWRGSLLSHPRLRAGGSFASSLPSLLLPPRACGLAFPVLLMGSFTWNATLSSPVAQLVERTRSHSIGPGFEAPETFQTPASLSPANTHSGAFSPSFVPGCAFLNPSSRLALLAQHRHI